MAKIIRITAKRDGFRRAGMAHSTASTDHPAEDFSAERLEELRAEPMLIVTMHDAPDPAPAEDAPGGKGKRGG